METCELSIFGRRCIKNTTVRIAKQLSGRLDEGASQYRYINAEDYVVHRTDRLSPKKQANDDVSESQLVFSYGFQSCKIGFFTDGFPRHLS